MRERLLGERLHRVLDRLAGAVALGLELAIEQAGELAGAGLQAFGQGVDQGGALVDRRGRPGGERGLGGGDRELKLGRVRLGALGEGFARRRVDDVETAGARGQTAVDEQFESVGHILSLP